ncbi:HepT-like ribonuclease domain-containing protein [Anabaenopsis elenkinii]|uniref:DUF86 domain-containing protein n=1 Tax=Anabaenopsis elenkinii CCIBt3563 TaxID=2779889 RepID=A0A7S6RCS5_9CYAN|nr:HepT-like ribonuclease domain-containing protein [Anabaenopsis elenkinii]QOV22566.1 DUF86 domain-containing protein [Anabaenopsis elenkinii CCIBt3563]
MRDNRLYLSNIKECIERIESYTSEGREAFMQTPMIQDAVIRNFEIIGEATKRLSAELRISYPNRIWVIEVRYFSSMGKIKEVGDGYDFGKR